MNCSVRRSLSVLRLVALGLWVSACSASVTVVPFADFTALTDAQIDSVQLKATVVGTRSGPPQITVVVVGDTAIDWTSFEAIEINDPRVSYLRSYASARRIAIPRAAMRALIDSVALVPTYVDAAEDSGGATSVSFIGSRLGERIGFDTLMDNATAAAVYNAMVSALGGEDDAVCAIASIARVRYINPDVGPLDVSGDVDVAVSGIRLDRASDEFVGRLVVSNVSAQALAGPIRIVLPVPGGVSLVNATGATCILFPTGAPYVEIAPSGLAVGESVEHVLRFSNPSRRGIPAIPAGVYAGAGVP